MYHGLICKVKTRVHPNADKIKIGVVCGHQVVVGLDIVDGDMGIFFPADGQLSHEMCIENKLYNKHPETGESMGGYFTSNRRVRAQSFRGEKSEGFWLPLKSLEWTGVDILALKDGEEIASLNGKLICEKYYTQATKTKVNSGQKKKEKKAKATTVMFSQHFDTAQYKYNSNKIPAQAVVYISEKLHGTSGRTGLVKVEYPVIGLKAKINNLFRKKIFKEIPKWKVVTGSRRVDYLPEQENESGTGFYVDSTFRFQISKSLEGSLKKGETLYYEIVGYTDTGKAIMGTHAIKDKELKKIFGSQMVYSYGCLPDTWKIFVYRITATNEDGDSVDLSWPNVMSRCSEIGIEHVPMLEVRLGADVSVEYIDEISDGKSTLDPATLREGVCLKIEHKDMQITLKNKGYNFKVLEGIIKDNENYVDEEEAS